MTGKTSLLILSFVLLSAALLALYRRKRSLQHNHVIRANGTPDATTITAKGITVRPGRVIDQTGKLR